MGWDNKVKLFYTVSISLLNSIDRFNSSEF